VRKGEVKIRKITVDVYAEDLVRTIDEFVGWVLSSDIDIYLEPGIIETYQERYHENLQSILQKQDYHCPSWV
jgi:hypothetical protein